MNNKIRVYSIVHNSTVLHTDQLIQTFHISEPLSMLKVRSIFFDLYIQNIATGILLNLASQNTQTYILRVGNVTAAGQQMTYPMQNESLPPYDIGKGKIFHMYNPGQIFFNSLYVYNDLEMNFTCNNRDAAIDYNYYFSVVVEAEIIQNINE